MLSSWVVRHALLIQYIELVLVHCMHVQIDVFYTFRIWFILWFLCFGFVTGCTFSRLLSVVACFSYLSVASVNSISPNTTVKATHLRLVNSWFICFVLIRVISISREQDRFGINVGMKMKGKTTFRKTGWKEESNLLYYNVFVNAIMLNDLDLH